MRCRNRHSAALTRQGSAIVSQRVTLVAAAFALTALSYGLARFAYGLLLPQIREDPSLSMSIAGWIGSATFAGYCLGIVVSFVVVPKRGERIVASLAGAGTSFLTGRLGIRFVHRLALLLMGLLPVTLAVATAAPILAFEIMGLFGAGYILSGGALLLWGIELVPDQAEFGLGLLFLMIATGQTVGAMFLGILSDASGYSVSLLCSTALIGGAEFWSPRFLVHCTKEPEQDFHIEANRP